MIDHDVNEAKSLVEKSECLFDQKTIEAAIHRIADAMNERFADEAPLLLCVMNGAVIFMGQLVTLLNFPLQIDYVHVTRYQGEIEGRELHWVAEPRIELKDRVVVIIEDILDAGLTLASVKDFCEKQGAKEVHCAVLIDKDSPRSKGGVETCEFTGLKVGNRFLFGYGLDYKGFLRNIPGIYAVKQ